MKKNEILFAENFAWKLILERNRPLLNITYRFRDTTYDIRYKVAKNLENFFNKTNTIFNTTSRNFKSLRISFNFLQN